MNREQFRPSRREFLTLAGIGALSVTLAGCTSTGKTVAARAVGTPFPKTWKKPITIDVFDDLANYQGIQSGWFAKVVEDKFNMKLNMIAPNVAGGGETLFNTRSAAGDLGDLVVIGSSDHLTQALQGGLLLDASAYAEEMPNMKEYGAGVAYLNRGQKGTFAFPSQVSNLKPTVSSEGADPTYGPYLRWDLYARLGYPTIRDLDDLLTVLKRMQQLQPIAPNGKKVYAFSLFKDWDANEMNNALQFASFFGYQQVGFVLSKADGSDNQSVLDRSGQYVQALRLYSKANRMGLIDPDSATQDYSTLFTKFQNGQVLFSWWPWLGQSAYNTDANMTAGKGFMLAPMSDLKVLSVGAQPYGGAYSLAIGSKAADPQRVAAFIDWLYSPEGVYANGGAIGGAPGPEGMTWTASGGKPALNAFGKKALLGGGTALVSPAWGAGQFSKGESALNFTTVTLIDEDPATGQPFEYTLWPSYQGLTANPLTRDWASHMKGSATTMDYLRKTGQLMIAPGASYVAPTDSSEIATLRNQVKATIVSDSWKLALSTSDAQFDAILTSMQSTADGLGYKKVLAVDMATARAQTAAQKAIVKKFG